MKYLNLLFGCLILFGTCDKADTPSEPAATNAPNLLLIIADDLGKDALAGFAEGSLKPSTPNLDQLRAEGLVFSNFWVNPTCSPTRAAIISGKYGYRTGVKWANEVLDPAEKTLQTYIGEATDRTYATALVGKWHLSGENPTLSPESFGIDYYAGLTRGAVQDYYRWQLTENAASSLETAYSSTVFTDLAIDWVNRQDQPWFLWLAYNAPHTPFHRPPSEMHSQGDLPDYVEGAEALPYYLAAIEAMDFQIGRLLAAIPSAERDNTVVFFLADNGTPSQVAQSPYSRSTVKGSLYQGGINVPLFVSGAGVTRRGVDNSLLVATDLFSTLAELAGSTTTQIHDSQSFKKLLSGATAHREFQYAERNDGTNDRWAISNGVFKLIVSADGQEELYELAADPFEGTNLLNSSLSAAAVNAKSALEAELRLIRN